MTVNTAGGVKIYIGGPGKPTTQGEFEAESWIEVGEAEDGGQLGDESAEIQFTALADGRVRKLKGPRDAGTQAVVCGNDPLDPGQVAMTAAEQERLDYAFKVQYADKVTLGGTGSIDYFYGKVMSRRRNIGNVSNVVRRTFNIGVNSAIIEVDPT